MTEAEWLRCNDLGLLLGFLHRKASDRKLRLFAVACCRHVWRWIKHPHCRQAVEASEMFADGGITAKRLRKVERLAAEATSLLVSEAHMTMRMAKYAERDASRAAVETAQVVVNPTVPAHWVREAIRFTPIQPKDQCSLIRDFYGPVLFRTVTVEPPCLSWNDGTVHKLAQATYDERAFGRLPLLADALEDAGCADADILSHCRTPGEHVRGCWAVDLLLGKS